MTPTNDSRFVFETFFKEEIRKGEVCPHSKDMMADGCTHKVCPKCGKLHFKNIPNYATSKGFFELKGLLVEKGLWDKFMRWCDNMPYLIEEVIEDPTTFLTHVYNFLREREG